MSSKIVSFEGFSALVSMVRYLGNPKCNYEDANKKIQSIIEAIPYSSNIKGTLQAFWAERSKIVKIEVTENGKISKETSKLLRGELCILRLRKNVELFHKAVGKLEKNAKKRGLVAIEGIDNIIKEIWSDKQYPIKMRNFFYKLWETHGAHVLSSLLEGKPIAPENIQALLKKIEKAQKKLFKPFAWEFVEAESKEKKEKAAEPLTEFPVVSKEPPPAFPFLMPGQLRPIQIIECPPPKQTKQVHFQLPLDHNSVQILQRPESKKE